MRWSRWWWPSDRGRTVEWGVVAVCPDKTVSFERGKLEALLGWRFGWLWADRARFPPGEFDRLKYQARLCVDRYTGSSSKISDIRWYNKTRKDNRLEIISCCFWESGGIRPPASIGSQICRDWFYNRFLIRLSANFRRKPMNKSSWDKQKRIF